MGTEGRTDGRTDDPPRCHTQLLDFGPPDVQGLLRHLRADDALQTRHLRCTLGAVLENYAPQALRHYSLRSKGTVMSTTPVS